MARLGGGVVCGVDVRNYRATVAAFVGDALEEMACDNPPSCRPLSSVFRYASKCTARCVSVATTLHRAALPEADLRDLLQGV